MYLSLENVNLILFKYEISVRLFHKGCQLSCHLITGRNVKHLSLEKVYLIVLERK